MNPPQPNFYNPQQQQQSWGAPPPMTSAPGQVPFQNGNQNGANFMTQQMAGMNLNGPPAQSQPGQFPPPMNNAGPPPSMMNAGPPKQMPPMGFQAPPPQMAANQQAPAPQQTAPMPPMANQQKVAPPPMANNNFPPPATGAMPPSNNFNNNLPPSGPPPMNSRPSPAVNGASSPPSMNQNQFPSSPQQQPPMAGQQGTMSPPPSMGNMPPPMGNMPPPMGSQSPMGNQAPSMGNLPPPMGNQAPPMGNQAPSMGNLPPPMGNQAPPMGNQPPLGNAMMGKPPMANQPPMASQQQPPMGQPPMPGKPPMMNQQPPMPGQPPMMGQQPPMPGQQPPMPGQQPPMPGQPPMMNPPLSNQHPPMPGQPPMMAQQPGMYPNQPPMSQYPPMPGAQPPFQQQNAYNQPQQQQMYPGQQMQTPPFPGQQRPGQMQYNQMPPGQQQYPGSPQYPQQPSQPQRRLDPDQMPNPIQVMSENQRTAGGVFSTNQAGLVPPLVTTKFVTQDQGQSGPRYIRSTMYNVPVNADMMKQAAVPFSLIISPLAKTVENEYPPPIVDFGEIGPIRCIRCKAYMCPNMQFIDAGRRFQCLLCKATTEVPAEYFQHLDHTGQRVDKYERPELVLGTYEFVATKDYCRNNTPPNPPAIVFVIDVSYNNIKSGLVHLLCSQMKEIVRNLPKDQGYDKSVMKVGFITYNNTVHFYNIKSSLAQPQMMVVGDLQEMFMPLLDGFLCDPEESSAVIDALMEQIPKMFAETRETETILLPAIQAGLEALKASETTGKLLIFHSTLPVAEAPGKLKNRDDRKLLGTEKEKTVLTPQCTVYNNVGQDCVQAGCSVDLFVFNNSYIDLATIGQVSRLTGGEIYKYTYFQADIDGQRLVEDIIKNVSRNVAFDGVMRVRTSAGVRPTDFYGHFFMSNTTDMEIAGIDSSKSIAIEIKHDDKLSPDENVYIQVALLYTSCSGQRRLRILNLSLKSCTQLADLFRSCDLDTTILFLAKQGLFKLLENTPRQIKDALVQRAAQILACYRKNCATPSSAGQLILPECMKLLPLYINCLLKNDAFSGGSDITLDDRSYAIYFVLSMDLPISVAFFYPRLIPIHDVDTDVDDIPDAIRCTGEKILDDGAYILENGVYMFLWLGLALSPEFTQQVFGVPSAQQIDTTKNVLPVLDTKLSQRVRGIIDRIQNEHNRCMRLTIVLQRDKLENVLRHFLVEDRGTDGSASYVDFLCHMHKEIRALLPS